MDCANHPQVSAVSSCKDCGEDYCQDCLSRGLCIACLGEAPGPKPKTTGIASIILIAGAILGGLCVFGSTIAAIAIPNLVEARKAGNEAAALGALKTISSAQALFREGDKDDDGVFNYGSLGPLEDANLIDGVLGGGTKNGYLFECEAGTDSPEFTWWATARPAIPGKTGDRYFYINQTGVIYFSKSGKEAPDPKNGAFPRSLTPIGR